MRFGEYIQKLRIAKGMTLAQAARELDTTPQKLCDIEQGRRYVSTRSPPLTLLKRIAAVYDHPFANLVTNTEFFQYEKSIISDLLGDLEPIVKSLETKALEMVLEARQYTPEMEEMAVLAHSLTQDLRAAVLLAKSRYSKGPRRKYFETTRNPTSG